MFAPDSGGDALLSTATSPPQYHGLEGFCNGPLWSNGSYIASAALPDASVCLQHTILAWIPVSFLIVFSIAFVGQVRRYLSPPRHYDPLPWSGTLAAKIVLSVILVLCSAALLVSNLSDSKAANATKLFPALWTVSFIILVAMNFARKSAGMATSGIQHITHILFVAFSAPQLYRVCQQLQHHSDLSSAVMSSSVAFVILYVFLVIMTVVLCVADRREVPPKGKESPELHSSWISRTTLWWFNEVAVRGAKSDLELDDLFDPNAKARTDFLYTHYESFWAPKVKEWSEKNEQREVGSEKLPSPSVVWTLFQMFKWDFLTASMLKICSDTLQFANPFLLERLMDFVASSTTPLWEGVAWAILMFVASETRSLLLNNYFFLMQRLGVKYQTSLMAVIYKKTLRLAASSRRENTIGEIVNLMSIDVERFQLLTIQVQQFWSAPYQLILCLVYLYYTLGYSALPGVLIMILFLPINTTGSIFMRKWQARQMKVKDERVKMVNEILNGIKVVKLYAWEPPLEERVDVLRATEIDLIWQAGLVRSVIDALNTCAPFLVALASFSTYIFSSSSHILTPQKAFVSLTLFNQIRSPLAMMALLIGQTVQASVSNSRFKKFFVADELDETAVDRKDQGLGRVVMKDVSLSWNEQPLNRALHLPAPPTLKDLTFTVNEGQLVAVVGRVGAGKSSLLSGLLGEMIKQKGVITVQGRIAYAAQQPWIQNRSLRDNITFGTAWDAKRYEKTVEACALGPDLKVLPDGDRTEIGEKGINLSGGQKARVSLARAVYSDRELFLLDDPLAAVDAHVGKHIFDKVVGPKGMLGGKTRILVTNAVTFLPQVDHIIILEEGELVEQGNYSDLMSRENGRLSRLVAEALKRDRAGTKTSSDLVQLDSSPEESSIEEMVDDETAPPPPYDAQAHGYSRQVSAVSRRTSATPRKSSVAPVAVETAKKLIAAENIEKGRVKVSVYSKYARAATWIATLLFTCLLGAFGIIQMIRSIWLSAWADDNQPPSGSKHHKNRTISNDERLVVFAAMGILETSCFFLALLSLLVAGLRASRNLHTPLLRRVMRAPMSFFDTTPMGRILNRFAKDVEIVDSLLPFSVRYFVMCGLQMLTTFIVIVFATPIFAAVLPVVGIIYYFTLRFYVPTSRQLKRLESVHRSPIYSHFQETIQGASSIRAYTKDDEFYGRMRELTDRYVNIRSVNLASNRWLGVRLEFIGNTTVFFAALLAALSKHWGWNSNAGLVGLSVSYALNVTEVLNFAVRQISELETNIVAVERIDEYCNIDQEADWVVEKRRPPKDWPSKGEISFSAYAARYRPGLDLVVRNLNFDLKEGEKVGIVGRTGAGKSSLALALFRMIEPASGRIVIDSIDIASIGLHDLRKNLTIIPQDPVLFGGTLRFNLDPFEVFSDADVWRALEWAHLKEFVQRHEQAAGLLLPVAEGGDNLSVGQRQLVCLARALLRRSRVLLLDEATAAVDLETDALIQATIREHFSHATVLTIAHRLQTILDYDRVMVLDHGRLAELDSPGNLLARPDSIFAGMMADAAAAEAEARQS